MRIILLLVGTFAAAVVACNDSAVAPDKASINEPGTEDISVNPSVDVESIHNMERITRAIAMALGNDSLRNAVSQDLQNGFGREKKIEFRTYMQHRGYGLLTAAAREAGMTSAEASNLVRSLRDLEFYLPVPAHRMQWKGTSDVLVAYQLEEGAAPVAFNTLGVRQVLSAYAPPSSPVLVLVPQETVFTAERSVSAEVCYEDCGGGGGGSSGGAAVSTPGIYLSVSELSDLGESWIKGDPEIEVILMGPASESRDRVTERTCSAGSISNYSPRWFDQNSNTWFGRLDGGNDVLLASQADLDYHKSFWPANTAYTEMGFVFHFWEDDDDQCNIKTDEIYHYLIGGTAVAIGIYITLTADPNATEAEWQRTNWFAAANFWYGLAYIGLRAGSDDDFLGGTVSAPQWNALKGDNVLRTSAIVREGVRNGAANIYYRPAGYYF